MGTFRLSSVLTLLLGVLGCASAKPPAAPGGASWDMYLDSTGGVTDRSLTGALAAGVPGSVAGLYEAHRKYGSKPWAELVQPASAALFLRDGRFVSLGTTWSAPELAAVLRRNALLGDPAFGPIATAAFLSKDTAVALRAEITDRASGGSGAPAAQEPPHTTHFSIVDARGNAVALTIVLDSAGALVLVTGAAGGAYIITGVAHQIVSLLDFHRSLGEAMAAPQFHFQDQPDSLVVEKVAWADSVAVFMAPLGHGVKTSPWGLLVSMHSIHREAGKWKGVAEPRGFGLAKGY